MRKLPEKFVEMIRELKGIDAEEFLKALNEGEPGVCVRVNSRKPGAYFPDSESLKWNTNAFLLSQRPEFIFDPFLHAGCYYVQEASSTIYETIVKKLIEKKNGETVKLLDACAAPGGKTTAMINSLPDGSEVWANEIDSKRVQALKENLAKWGYPCKITNLDTSYFKDCENRFDIIAVDAPCSGEGMMRKEEVAINQWSPQLVEKCSSLQKEILNNVIHSLNEGGYLIYSTCTYNRKENEENAEFIVNELKLEPVDMHFPENWGIQPGIDTELPVMRFMPHRSPGEGLFVAVFRKPMLNEDSDKLLFSGQRESKKNGLKKECKKLRIKNTDKNPNSIKQEEKEDIKVEALLSVNYKKGQYPEVELTIDEAMTYLRGEILKLPEDTPKGIVIMRYKGHILGPVKNIGTRANNLYPKGWRIRKSFIPGIEK